VFLQDGIPHQSCLSQISTSFRAHYFPYPSFDFNSLGMQRSAFILTIVSLLAFFSLAFASPLPVQVIKEMREVTVELSARQAPVDHKILHREVSTDPESGANLNILAREHTTFDEYVQEMTGAKDVARDTQDMEPRMCRGRLCL